MRNSRSSSRSENSKPILPGWNLVWVMAQACAMVSALCISFASFSPFFLPGFQPGEEVFVVVADPASVERQVRQNGRRRGWNFAIEGLRDGDEDQSVELVEPEHAFGDLFGEPEFPAGLWVRRNWRGD